MLYLSSLDLSLLLVDRLLFLFLEVDVDLVFFRDVVDIHAHLLDVSVMATKIGLLALEDDAELINILSFITKHDLGNSASDNRSLLNTHSILVEEISILFTDISIETVFESADNFSWLVIPCLKNSHN